MLPILQVKIGKDNIIPLYRLRGSVRPVLIMGTQSHIQKALKSAEKDYEELRKRGISGCM